MRISNHVYISLFIGRQKTNTIQGVDVGESQLNIKSNMLWVFMFTTASYLSLSVSRAPARSLGMTSVRVPGAKDVSRTGKRMRERWSGNVNERGWIPC